MHGLIPLEHARESCPLPASPKFQNIEFRGGAEHRGLSPCFWFSKRGDALSEANGQGGVVIILLKHK